jgi:hypothetical protein
MPNSKDTTANRLQRAMLKILEGTEATVRERLDAADRILRAKEIAKQRERSVPRKQPKLVIPSFSVLGSK